MSKYVVLMVVAVLICAATAANATLIYSNNFSTAALRADMTVAGTAPIAFTNWWLSPPDMEVWIPNGNYGWATLTKQIMAPAGMLINSPTFSAGVSHYSSWSTGASIDISYDGTNWGYGASTGDNYWLAGCSTGSTAADPLYQNLSSVWIRVTMSDYHGSSHPWESQLARVAGLSVDGALVNAPGVPEPGSMLALGSGLMGLFGFAIRRRR